MGASGELFGEDHPATEVPQPPATHRRAQLSGELHGEAEDHGYKQPITVDSDKDHDFGLDD